MALGGTHHHINLQVGYDKFNSSLSREDYRLATHQSYQKLDYTPPSNPLPDKFKPILGSNNKPICLDAYGYGHDHPQACNAKTALIKILPSKRHRAIQPKTNTDKIDYQAIIDQYDKQNPNSTLKPFEKIKQSLGQEKIRRDRQTGL